MKVTVLGAAGGIGQPLSLILKNSLPAGSSLSLYDVNPSTIVAETSLDHKAKADKVYFIKNVDETDAFVSWTFKQTKVDDDVTGLFEATITPGTKATSYAAGHFYFDVYNQNNGAYAVKVIKVVD